MKLSIITINYNNMDGLQKTIDSVVCQTWRDFEWIIIDGGSTDGSKELIEQYQRYFAYWCSEPDKGVYNAMNKGVGHARGEYLLFLNSGDCFHNSEVLKTVHNDWRDVDVIYGDLNYVSHKGDYIISYPDSLTTHYFLCHSIGHPASFIKAQLLKGNGYREDFKIVSDWYKFLELFRCGCTFHHINVIVSDYDTTGISSVNMDLISKENEVVFKEVFGDVNRKWIEESHQMQTIYEKVAGCGFLRIMKNGGKRMRFLTFIIHLLNRI